MVKDPFQQQKDLKKAAQAGAPLPKTPYQKLYGLSENPFPVTALFTASVEDPRRNGKIYDRDFRKDEEREFFRKFVKTPTGDPPLSLGFLLLAPQSRARGNGKSAFLNRLMRRINEQDWGDFLPEEPNDPEFFALGVHVLPEPRKQKNFFELARLVFQTLHERKLIQRIDAAIRAATLLGMATEDQLQVLEEMPSDQRLTRLESRVQFRELLEILGIVPAAFIDKIGGSLTSVLGHDVSDDLLVRYLKEEASLQATWEAWENEGVVKSDYRWQRSGARWLVDGLMALLVAAGYRRFYLLLDEFEKIYQYQTSKKRDEFLDLFRQHFLERDSVAVRRQYISSILTLHPGILRSLPREWARSGLEQIAPLATDRMGAQSVELGPSNSSKLSHLLITYLDYFRIDSQHSGTLYPFETGALDPVYVKAQFFPRDTIWYASTILQAAAKESLRPPISKSYVEKILATNLTPPPDDEDEVLPESETDLRS